MASCNAGLLCAGYVGDACQTCGNGYTLAGGLCQRTLESFQAEAALAGKPAQLPTAPAPAPRGLAVPKVTSRPFPTDNSTIHLNAWSRDIVRKGLECGRQDAAGHADMDVESDNLP